MTPSHGLKPVAWDNTLQNGPENVLSLGVTAAGGTFRALAMCLWHWHVARVVTDRHEFAEELWDLGRVQFAEDGTSLTLGDLISRSRYTGGSFADITGYPSRAHRGVVYRRRDEFSLGFPQSNSRMPEAGIPEPFRGRDRFSRGDQPIPLFHCVEAFGEGFSYSMCIVEPFRNGDRLSEFLKLYVISYVLGMLARYFPSQWKGLLRNDAGGRAQPLLASAVRAIETELVKEFAPQIAVLADDPGFFGSDFGLGASEGGVLRDAWQEARGSRGMGG